jgi:hypothetical protein
MTRTRPEETPAVRLTWSQVLAWRLARSHLVDRSAHRVGPVQAAMDVCGLHAQVMSASELQAWARTAHASSGGVARALWDDRTLVKTWAMRGTLHLLPARELPAWTAALTTRDQWRSPTWLRYFGYTLEEIEGIMGAIGEVLSAEPMTREELTDAVVSVVGQRRRKTLLQGWGTLFKPAAAMGLLCFGPNRGRNVTFVRPDRWLSKWADVHPAEGIRQVVRRFLHTYGPATAHGFSAWWGVPPVKGRQLFASVVDEAVMVDVEGFRASALVEDVDAIRAAGRPRGIRLLPNFDPYVMGSRPRSAVVDGAHAARVSRAAGWISPVILVDGRAAGVWDQKRRGGRLEVRVDPFRPVSATVRRKVEAVAERLGTFAGAATDVTWTE